MSQPTTLEGAKTTTTATFLTSLATNCAIAGGEFLAWVILRRVIKAVYEPRTYIPRRDEQSKPLGKNLVAPLWHIMMADPKDILHKNGVDPYVFLRFLRMLAKALVPIWLISWVILLPVDSVGSNVINKEGLDRFTFGNIAGNVQDRYWAHLVLVYAFNGWFMFLMWREMKIWLEIRQSYLVTPRHSKLAQANTVLITGIPKHLMDERELAKLFAHLPGGVKRIWLTRDLKDMPKVYQRREKACALLESAEVGLIKAAQKRKHDLNVKAKKLHKKGQPIPDSFNEPANPPAEDGSEQSLEDQLVPRSARPRHRLKPTWSPIGLGFLGIGAKVDTVEWARLEIADCNRILNEERETLAKDIDNPEVGTKAETYPPLASAFIHFHQQIAAHMARQCLSYNEPYQMNRRFIEQSPANVIWSNMSLNEYEVNGRTALSYALTVGLVIAWVPISAFIGVLSNVSTLTAKYKWLAWLGGTSAGKKILQGVVTGILPPVLLALGLMFIPIIFRQFSALQGTVSKTEVELDIMNRYFLFLVIHAFLITTIVSGVTASFQQLTDIAENPASVATILAHNMPTASTFFITRILLQFTGTMGTLLQPITLTFYIIRVILGGGTPRKIFNARYRMPTIDFGTDFPNVTVYAIIMISYMIISPVINGFGAAFSALSYFVYKYLFTWVINQPAASDTGGLFFPKAVTHIFVGLYIQEVCLCALFFLARNSDGKVSALPQAILMIILIVITAAVNYVIKRAYNPLITALPLSMADLSYGMNKEEPRPSTSSSKPAKFTDDLKWDEKDRKWEVRRNSVLDSPPVERSKLPVDGDTSEETAAPREVEENYIQLAEMGRARSRAGSIASRQHVAGDACDEPEEPEEDAEAQYFAVPGGPGVQRGLVDDGDDPAAFFHPASKDPQKSVWLPLDDLGLGAELIAGNIAAGVKSSGRNAKITKKGLVVINGVPPDHLDD